MYNREQANKITEHCSMFVDTLLSATSSASARSKKEPVFHDKLICSHKLPFLARNILKGVQWKLHD